ncbi:MAG: PAC2 family protein [Actinobacteria bacterium]|nr:PAC2 family protein [Actinomycetota bacterium]
MSALVWDDHPELSRPVLVAAFEGWNDAAEAASSALGWLRHRWDAQKFAHADPDAYFDFQAIRPQVTLVDGVTRELRWPANEYFAARIERDGRDAVLLSGVEPSYRWREFCSEVVSVVRETSCEMVVTLGALLADVPHTRPTRITGTAVDDALARRLGLERSRYEGPTGIVGVLHDACRRAGIPSVSLWAPVPHYIANPPNPVATLALLDAVSGLLDAPTDTGDLRGAADVWRARVDAALADDDETGTYVSELEERYDEEVVEADLPTADELASEIEQYLRGEPGSGG